MPNIINELTFLYPGTSDCPADFARYVCLGFAKFVRFGSRTVHENHFPTLFSSRSRVLLARRTKQETGVIGNRRKTPGLFENAFD